MIVSASRRTDIPAFYAEWMINRIKAGYCTVFNPFNREQVKHVSLRPEDIEVIVFWTKNSRPLREKLSVLDERRIRYYFQYTLTHYTKELETRAPSFDLLKTEFIRLSNMIGPDRIVWRYDPIVVSNDFSFDRHLDLFGNLATELRGLTYRVVISLVDFYKKTIQNMCGSSKQNTSIDQHPERDEGFERFMRTLSRISMENDIEIQSCAEPIDLATFGIERGKCVDDGLIQRVFNLEVTHRKDSGQRDECGCVKSIDIGVYNTCLHGCQYCYATKNHAAAKSNFEDHDPHSPSLVGWHDRRPDKAPLDDQMSLVF